MLSFLIPFMHIGGVSREAIFFILPILAGVSLFRFAGDLEPPTIGENGIWGEILPPY